MFNKVLFYSIYLYYLDLCYYLNVLAGPTVSPRCGIDCNKTIIITPNSQDETYYWQSDGWGLTNYTEDCVCVLTVEVSLAFNYKFNG